LALFTTAKSVTEPGGFGTEEEAWYRTGIRASPSRPDESFMSVIGAST
jgi:hypothetical protein